MFRFLPVLFTLLAVANCQPPHAASPPPVKHVAPLPQPTPAVATTVKVIAAEAFGVQETRWRDAVVRPVWQISVNKEVMRYLQTQARYETVSKMRSDGVPAPVIFTLHYRESSCSFTSHLHEGSSLLHRTRYVPKGRLPAPKEPPYSWEDSAEDAIYICDRLQGDWHGVKQALDKIESYNGVGYRKRAVPSPYLFSGTTIYSKGKFTSDGHFSATAIDQQLGCVAILKTMQQRGIQIGF